MLTRTRILAAALAVASFVALTACGGDDSVAADPGDPPIELTKSGGCADAFFWAASVGGTVAVTVRVEQRDRSTTEPTIIDFAIPDDDVVVEVQTGRGLTQPMCNDAIDGNVYRLDSEAPAISGHGRIELAPRPSPANECGATRGSLRLEDVVADDGTRFADVQIESTDIGCYAG